MKLFRSGETFPFFVASFSKVLKVIIEHPRMTDQTHLLRFGLSIRSNQGTTPGAKHRGLWSIAGWYGLIIIFRNLLAQSLTLKTSIYEPRRQLLFLK
jgi:hypothetical protein